MTDTQTCSAQAYSGDGRFGDWYPCRNKTKMQHEGKGYCGVHDPVKREAKREVSQAKWDADMKRAIERSHKLNTYQDLLDALRGMLDTYGENQHGKRYVGPALEAARAAIEKAEKG